MDGYLNQFGFDYADLWRLVRALRDHDVAVAVMATWDDASAPVMLVGREGKVSLTAKRVADFQSYWEATRVLGALGIVSIWRAERFWEMGLESYRMPYRHVATAFAPLSEPIAVDEPTYLF